MSTTRKRRKETAPDTEAPPPDLNLLLREIEKEPVPEKLLALAFQLQAALAERRRREEIVKTQDLSPVPPRQTPKVTV